MLIRDAELQGRGIVDLRLSGGQIAEIGAALSRRAGESVFEARGGALLPGLQDHHLHLFALAAAERSIDCGPSNVPDAEALGQRLREASRSAPEGAWLRGVAYHESIAGPLDRERLDAWLPDRPLRLQHRSGALWMLNSAALLELQCTREPPTGLERDESGRPTGRLFRGDAWLRERLREPAPDLSEIGARLAAYGVCGVTDASAQNDAGALQRLEAAVASGQLCQSLQVMGQLELPQASHPRVKRGPVKTLLDEPRLPELDAFVERIRASHAEGRAMAVHCATRVELVFASVAFREAGTRPGDRLEHASVAPPESVALIRDLGLIVVTQPHFIAERGDAYLHDVEPTEHPWLYRARAWLEAGVPLGGGSDAPYGSPDPWASMRAATRRRTPAEVVLGPDEALSPEAALALFTSPLEAPGSPAPPLAAGARADLCLLDRPWTAARQQLVAEQVAATWCRGRLCWER